MRFRKYSQQPKEEIVDFDGFFHPLDGLKHWNRLYGKRGFFQYQCILPESETSAEDVQELLEFIHRKRLFSYLAVIKYHGAHEGMLSFSQGGYSLALDFPNTKKVRKMVEGLNRHVLEKKGKIYLAKDALLSAGDFQLMYEDVVETWRDAVEGVNPRGEICSAMAERLQMLRVGKGGDDGK